jgi:hypothetical protein
MDIVKLLPQLRDLLTQNPGWLDEAIDTEEASRITGVPVDSLVTMRSRGGGPIHIRPKGTRLVRYFRRHLYQWLLSGGLKRNTADAPPDHEKQDSGG